jgi:hypothetical protein
MPTRVVVVTVVDSAGVALDHAEVNSTNSRNQSAHAATDAAGVARLRVPTEIKAQLSVHHAAVGPREFLQCSGRELHDGETDVTIVLEDAAAVTGRLVDESGAPVANASLSVFKANASSSGGRTDDDGRFRVLVSREGRSDLAFDGWVAKDRQMENSGLAARADGVAPGSDVTLTCRRIVTDRKLTVVVVSPQGAPVANAFVFVDWPGGSVPRARTDASGHAEIGGLPAREVMVEAGPAIVDDLMYALPARLVPDGQEVRLACRATIVTKGKVVDESGVAVSGGSLRVVRGGDVICQMLVGVGGVFWIHTPADETAPMRLEVDRDGDGSFETKLDGVRPGAQDVRVVVKK